MVDKKHKYLKKLYKLIAYALELIANLKTNKNTISTTCVFFEIYDCASQLRTKGKK